MLAGLPYVVWPVGSLFILASPKKDEPFLNYHAWQGLWTGLVMLAFSFLSFLGMVLLFRLLPGSASYVPGMLGMSLFFGGMGILLVAFFTAVFLGWRATEGEMVRLPYLGDLAEQKMLDHTGMTRRQFMGLQAEYQQASSAEYGEEEIPFPELSASPGPGSRAAAQVRVEAARAARSQAPPNSPRVSPPRPIAEPRSQRPPQPTAVSSPPPGVSRPVEGKLPSAFQAKKNPAGSTFERSGPSEATPRVKEVDLVRHYKDLKSVPGANTPQGTPPAQHKDVLKKWLSSVDPKDR